MRPPLAHPLGRALGLLLGSLALGLLGNAVHPAGVSLRSPVRSLAEQGQCSAPEPLAQGPVRIAPRDAQALRGQPGVVFGDLRPAARYADGHVAGALHLPCSGSLGQAALGRLPRSTRLVLYDEDGQGAELHTAAATALMRGLGEVYILEGGFGAWLAAGLPAESGSCEGCGGH